MPKFVPVSDPEAPRWEQDEAALAKHRNFDSGCIARDQTEQRQLAAGRRAATKEDRANRGFEQGAVGWGVVGTFGSDARDADAQAHPAEGKLKMVRKGDLWVRVAKEDGVVEEAPAPARSRSRGRRRGRSRSRSRSRGRRRRDRSRSRSRGRRRDRRSPSPRRREPTREERERAALDKLRRERRPPPRRPPPQRRPPSPRRAMPPPPPRPPRSPPPPPREPPPENDAAAPDFSFSCSQLVDRLLEIFNSDAPPQHRCSAIEQCFAADGLCVAALRAGTRPTAQQGKGAVESIVKASERLAEAQPSLRIFMESGDEAESPPDPAHPTLVLDVYAAGAAPGLAAVVKGAPATTLVLWRCYDNKLTHAWVAPDRDAYADDWAAVDEDRFLASRAMAATNEVLAEQLPAGSDYWNFHWNNYAVDIINI